MTGTAKDPNYYDLLGVERGASAELIRARYRRLMQQGGNHPDRGGDADAAAQINKAYAVLRDADARAEYDIRLDILEMVAEGLTISQARRVLRPERECLFCQEPHSYAGCDMVDLSCSNCGSALQPVSQRRIEPDGQRAIERIDKSLDLQIFTDARQTRGYPARSEDVSPQGLRITTRIDLRKGQRLHIVSDILDAVGEVTHCASNNVRWRRQTIAGIAFLTLRFRRATGAFVSRQV